MRVSLSVAADLLREAASRRWFLALGAGITLVLVTLALSLRMDVVDGAIAGTRLFGSLIDPSIRAADVALRPLFMGAAALIYYGGTIFLVVACSDFGPEMLSPGRIEHLLSMPVRRWELAVGTFLGVCTVAVLCGLYGAGGLTVLLGFKTGVWTWRPLAAAGLAAVNFATLYAFMLALAFFVRSAALSAGGGVLLFILGAISGNRRELSAMFDPGFGRTAFDAATLFFPRVSTLGKSAIMVAGSRPIDGGALVTLLAGFAVFALSMLAVGIWQFERKDF